MGADRFTSHHLCLAVRSLGMLVAYSFHRRRDGVTWPWTEEIKRCPLGSHSNAWGDGTVGWLLSPRIIQWVTTLGITMYTCGYPLSCTTASMRCFNGLKQAVLHDPPASTPHRHDLHLVSHPTLDTLILIAFSTSWGNTVSAYSGQQRWSRRIVIEAEGI